MNLLENLTESKTAIYNISPDLIDVEEGFNPRFDYGDLDGLGKSIWVHHVKKPLEVIRVGDRFILDDGHRRNAAIKLNLKRYGKVSSQANTVPVIINNADRGRIVRLAGTIISNDGKPLLPIEEANVFQQLKKEGLSSSEISEMCGKSITHVNDRLTLVSGDKTILEAVRNGNLKTSVGIQAAKTLKKMDKKLQASAIKQVLEGGEEAVKKLVARDHRGRFKIRKTHKELMAKWVEELKETKDPMHACIVQGRMQGFCAVLNLSQSDWDSLETGVPFDF